MATPNFSTLLHDAVNKPGTIMKAYSAFHIPEKNAQKILKAADQILKAGATV
jgi:hypothetical protein